MGIEICESKLNRVKLCIYTTLRVGRVIPQLTFVINRGLSLKFHVCIIDRLWHRGSQKAELVFVLHYVI